MFFLKRTVCKSIHLLNKRTILTTEMANSKYEYVKEFENDDKLLQNCWIVVRIDGKGFHKFTDHHSFEKPNDARGLNLMNRSAIVVMQEFRDIILSYGQSDEYTFVLQKNTILYNRRSSKILTNINSLFASAYVYNWQTYFGNVKLKYPPSFDGRVVLYPSDTNLKDYLSWRQADVHINNLYNTSFWNLVLNAKLTNAKAEERLRGTLSGEKNEILFSEFGINYNNEPLMYRKGTTLLRKQITDPVTSKKRQVIVPFFVDMIQEKFWKEHSEILEMKPPLSYEFPDGIDLPECIERQLKGKRTAVCSSAEISDKIQSIGIL